ncbi:MAG: toxin-antitoxin system HicB family antitoxin [Dehalococcoidia bacterium]
MTKTRKTADKYLELNYPFRVDADPDGGYVVTFPDLPGCMTQVESAEEIGQAAEEARRLWIMTECDDGADIPLPSYPEEYSGKFNLRLPKSLHRRLAELAEREGVSLNQLVLSLLAAPTALPVLRREGPPAKPARSGPRRMSGRSGGPRKATLAPKAANGRPASPARAR